MPPTTSVNHYLLIWITNQWILRPRSYSIIPCKIILGRRIACLEHSNLFKVIAAGLAENTAPDERHQRHTTPHGRREASQGTPPILIPFIVCIETIRNVIRPGTLAVRLTANIIAGHLLITLLGNTGPISSSYIILSLILITQIALLVLESAVAIIQSYVFAVLRTLYSSEVN